MTEIGETYVRRDRPPVRAVQLVPNADWEAVAAWCGGWLINLSATGNPIGIRVMIPSGLTAGRYDWIVRHSRGSVTIHDPGQFAALFARPDSADQAGDPR